MNDEVNNPSHYNQNGIEVIDVIETYAKHDFRLANVLKYVCRAGYKGHPLQDLQKAQWYLNRVVSEMEVVEALTDESWLDREESVDDANEEWVGPGYTTREVDVFFEGYECRKQEEAEIEKKDALYQSFKEPVERKHALYRGRSTYEVHTSPDRIAGDDAVAKDIKDTYYDFNRFEIKGYCANCDKELPVTQPHVTDYSFDEGVKFCSAVCAEQLKVWQGR